MMMNCVRTGPLAVLAVSLMSLLVAGAAFASEPPEVSHDGLHLVPETKLGLVYIKPGADFSTYQKIALLDLAVAFRKDWQRDQNRADPLRVSKHDMDEIREKLAERFAEVMREELTAGGEFELVDSAGDDVLIMRPAIVDLDITVPAAAGMSSGRSRTIATSAGAMTLYVEFFDGASGEILARVADREGARNWGTMQWQNSGTNRAEATRILKGWAKTLHNGLDQVRALPASLVP